MLFRSLEGGETVGALQGQSGGVRGGALANALATRPAREGGDGGGKAGEAMRSSLSTLDSLNWTHARPNASHPFPINGCFGDITHWDNSTHCRGQDTSQRGGRRNAKSDLCRGKRGARAPLSWVETGAPPRASTCRQWSLLYPYQGPWWSSCSLHKANQVSGAKQSHLSGTKHE